MHYNILCWLSVILILRDLHELILIGVINASSKQGTHRFNQTMSPDNEKSFKPFTPLSRACSSECIMGQQDKCQKHTVTLINLSTTVAFKDEVVLISLVLSCRDSMLMYGHRTGCEGVWGDGVWGGLRGRNLRGSEGLGVWQSLTGSDPDRLHVGGMLLIMLVLMFFRSVQLCELSWNDFSLSGDMAWLNLCVPCLEDPMVYSDSLLLSHERGRRH